MAIRTIEMHHDRQALLRMRQGDSDRQIAAARLLGRRAASSLGLFARERDWRHAGTLMPSDESIASALKPAKKAGLGQSAREWSAQEGWNGRMLNQYEANGILVEALEVLVVYDGDPRLTTSCEQAPCRV